jgi:hypothetical protein
VVVQDQRSLVRLDKTTFELAETGQATDSAAKVQNKEAHVQMKKNAGVQIQVATAVERMN